MKIYIQVQQAESGPFSQEEVVDHIKFGGLPPDSLGRTEENPTWRPLAMIISSHTDAPPPIPTSTPPPLPAAPGLWAPPPLLPSGGTSTNIEVLRQESAPADALPQRHQGPSGELALAGVLALNVAIYGLMLLDFGFKRFSPQDVADWGGLYVPLVMKGEIWRMLTANYLHFDFKHILFNMIALLNWGPPVAQNFGVWRFVLFYTITGISGSIASFIFHPNAVCAGASGAASGILGALIAMRIMGDQTIQKGALIQATVYNCVIPIALPSVDWQAHLGGLLAGIVLGFLLTSRRSVC